VPAVVSTGIRTTDLRKAEVPVCAVTLSLRLSRHRAKDRKIRCFTDKRGGVYSVVETWRRILLCQVYSAKRELCKLIDSDPTPFWTKTINKQTSRRPSPMSVLRFDCAKTLKMWQVGDSRRNYIKFVVHGFSWKHMISLNQKNTLKYNFFKIVCWTWRLQGVVCLFTIFLQLWGAVCCCAVIEKQH